MKKAQSRNKDLNQAEEHRMRSHQRSDELLAKLLADDFCEFGSSEVIGLSLQKFES
jgi:hypothetical protein